MTLLPEEVWQRQRSALNHAWMKNQFLSRLGNYVNLLSLAVTDPDRERRFNELVIDEWAGREAEMGALLLSLAESLSPKVLLKRPPLARANATTLEWLSEVVHLLWLHRCHIPQLLGRANDEMEGARCAYRRLVAQYRDLAATNTARDLQPLAPALLDFRDSCVRLTNAFSALPGRVRVV